MNRRKETLSIIPKQSIGIEIGVWKADFSQSLINVVKPTKLFLVDPWVYQPISIDGNENYSDRWYGGSIAKNQKDMDNIYNNVASTFQKNNAIKILRCYSTDIEKYIANSSLDWCYIDGNHSYENVFQDLKVCYQLSKKKSLIIGDDYDNSEDIRQAVKTFVDENKNNIYSTQLIEGQFILYIEK